MFLRLLVDFVCHKLYYRSSSVANKTETIKYLTSNGAELTATSSERVCTSPTFFSLQGSDNYPTLPSTLLMTAATEHSYELYQTMIKLGEYIDLQNNNNNNNK